mmetsp:Transcript_13257/g.25417  ORF Transcript_13257/g.25417 Transcript_13257/m.25417 type:complete len:88 (-) Transcript_13257:2639-2902(-)|eukprot:scaffold14035_cov172-Amphora_coffeaeformis.AAC.6
MNPQEATGSKPNSTDNNFDPNSCNGFTLCEALVLSAQQGVAGDWGLPAKSSSPPIQAAPSIFNADHLMVILQEAQVEVSQEDLFGEF